MIGKVDLGASLMRVDFLRQANLTSFVGVLRERYIQPTPKDYYEADGNFIEQCKLFGARVGLIRKLNFVHG